MLHRPGPQRAVIHNFNDEGFESVYPRYRGGRPPTFTPTLCLFLLIARALPEVDTCVGGILIDLR